MLASKFSVGRYCRCAPTRDIHLTNMATQMEIDGELKSNVVLPVIASSSLHADTLLRQGAEAVSNVSVETSCERLDCLHAMCCMCNRDCIALSSWDDPPW